MPVTSTMMDFPLTISHVLRHGATVHAGSEVITWSPEGVVRSSFAQVAVRAAQLANLLSRLGIGPGDVVGTLCWNHQRHMEAYLAVPAMGSVLLTLNLRVGPDQLAFAINRGEARAIIADAMLLPLLEEIADRLPALEHVIVVDTGTGRPSARTLGPATIVSDYDVALAGEASQRTWLDCDERAPSGICFTSGTTGDPKGVVYSHRSQVLHAMSLCSASAMGINDRDRVLVTVPLFHVNAWGTPYAGWWSGADLLMPQQYLQAPHLAAMIEEQRPTFAGGVPTLWNDLYNYAADRPVDFSSLRLVVGGGSAVPRGLIERFHQRFGVPLSQGWGMTECSPIAAVARPPRGVEGADVYDYHAYAGRVVAGVELRLVAEDGTVQPWDGAAFGEIQLRGPWVTGAYLGNADPDRFMDGWLRTGDVGTVTPNGYVRLVDRAKDVIKSGGEWISSVALETRLMNHPGVTEAAVIGVVDERWGERPLAFVVRAADSAVSEDELGEWIAAELPRWQVPERWRIVDAIPRTSVGKFDKKALRVLAADG